MGAFDHPALDEVREVLVEEGSICEHTNDDGPTIIVDVDDVADKIVNALSRCGYLRWDNVR